MKVGKPETNYFYTLSVVQVAFRVVIAGNIFSHLSSINCKSIFVKFVSVKLLISNNKKIVSSPLINCHFVKIIKLRH